jgi:hypothetical protein
MEGLAGVKTDPVGKPRWATGEYLKEKALAASRVPKECMTSPAEPGRQVISPLLDCRS